MSELEISNEREKKGERSRGNGHYDLRPLPRVAYGPSTLGKRSNCSDGSRRTKMQKQEMFSDLWTNMPTDVYYEITRRLSLPDYLNSSRVCKDWLLSSYATRQTYLKSVPPFAVTMKVIGKKTMSFHNMMADEIYKTKVMYYVRKCYKGISSGFIAMENLDGIWFADPISSKEFEFLKTSGPSFSSSDRVILTKLVPGSDYLVVVLHKESQTIRASRLGNGNWVGYSYSREAWNMVDLVAHRGRVLGLTSNGMSGVVQLSASLVFRPLTIKTKFFSDKAKLVISVDCWIMAVDVSVSGIFQIFRLDIAQREWTHVRDLGNQSLFIDAWNTCMFCDPRGWGGLTNCIYSLESAKCSVFSVANGGKIQEHEIRKATKSFSRVWGWYFPHLMYKVAHAWDDDQRAFQARWYSQQPQLPPVSG